MDSTTTSPAGTTEWIDGPDGVSFFTKRWQAEHPKANVVFCHGIIEHVERYDYFFSSLANRGITTFAFDQRGWGRTAQKTNTEGITDLKRQLKDLEFFLARELNTYNPEKLFLFGHSMGGGIVMQYACTESLQRPSLSKLAGIISSSPITVQPPDTRVGKVTLYAGALLGRLLPSLQMKIDIKGTDLSHDQAVVDEYLKDPLCPPIATYKQLADMFFGGEALLSKTYKTYPSELPLLIYHGSEDKVTWHEASKQLVDKITASNKTFTSYEGYYHECHNEPGDMKERVIDDVSAWILKRA
ncbi:lysophospholipase [Cystobasidium minutum MCA 4210]|uniref:lysophospholipase n=1 Tax=Cystobasidium minutum MCA 4210 TaxID=1397322 RepID=UPI0034CDF1A1|eukprot:jgi/Rhomi1/79316/CE79315_882